MSVPFTPAALAYAVRSLFELNHYTVEGPIQVNGAEIDLVATPRSDPFASPIYIEVTIEYVDVVKYGADLTKLAMAREANPAARCLVVSSKGFTVATAERAKATRIETLTYDQLFAKFERFDPYTQIYLGNDERGRQLRALTSVYEEPDLDDSHGRDRATEFLTEWRDRNDPQKRWIILVGEYGTGKTALTRMLQFRWLNDYKNDAALPIPFRIELRDFTRQFDARGLLHHFLDQNRLQDVPIDFVFSLIRSGRVVLILDGYDEMAQYMHARERRACLEALAHLSSQGARGLLTSRPNYFSDAEELQIFEVLYRRVASGPVALTSTTRALLENERAVDSLLDSYVLNRFERSLRDLTPEQTESLVVRRLGDDERGRVVVLSLLRRVFRGAEHEQAVSLSGKPVIIGYLLDIVEGLKAHDTDSEKMSEWQIYRLIVDQLMNRDFLRVPEIEPAKRRRFLQILSLFLSQRDNPVISEGDFRDLVRREFQHELQRHLPETREQEVERYFSDLRSSATLTRSTDASRDGWRFSHNSLREYLLTELLLNNLDAGSAPFVDVPLSDAMRSFAASLDDDRLGAYQHKLATLWSDSASRRGAGILLNLLWDGFLMIESGTDPAREIIMRLGGASLRVEDLSLKRLVLSSVDAPANFDNLSAVGVALSDIQLAGASLRDANFTGAILENVNFSEADLSGAIFVNSLLVDIKLSSATIAGACFYGVTADDLSILLDDRDVRERLVGQRALAFLRFHGAMTDDIPIVEVMRFHPRFEIVEKIILRFGEQHMRQRLGLVQRGVSRKDQEFAETFVQFLEKNGFVTRGRKGLVGVTDLGRELIGQFETSSSLNPVLETFLRDHLSLPATSSAR